MQSAMMTRAMVSVMTVSLALGAAAAPKKHLKLGKSSTKAGATASFAGSDLSAASIATLQSLDPSFLAQPVAVIATYQKSGVRVIVETPPRGTLAGSGRGTVLARGTYGSLGGSVETFPSRLSSGGQLVDAGLADAAVAACTQLVRKHALASSFVIIVQPAVDHFDVIYSPIPYKESQTQLIAVTSAGKPGRISTTATPQLPPAQPQPEAPQPDIPPLHNEDNPN